jgi:hypothetical protein
MNESASVHGQRIRLTELVSALAVDPQIRDAGEHILQRADEVLDGLLGRRAGHVPAREWLLGEGQEHSDSHDLGAAGPVAELPGLPLADELLPRHLQLSLRTTVQ